jgi:hypothetical protein
MMNVNKPTRNTIWSVEVERLAPFAAELAAFSAHKQTLLDNLHKVHERCPKSEPFDEDESWRALTRAAIWCFKRRKIETVLPARRRERLRDLAKALRRSHRMAHKAMQDDVGFDLFRGWCDEANISPTSPQVLNANGSSVLTRIADQIKEVVASLATLEAAASRAARGVSMRAGRPRGTGIFPLDDITALARIYQRSTGQKPIMGAGPFAQFVEEFLNAIGRGDDTSRDYVFEALKYARKQAHKNSSC